MHAVGGLLTSAHPSRNVAWGGGTGCCGHLDGCTMESPFAAYAFVLACMCA